MDLPLNTNKKNYLFLGSSHIGSILKAHNEADSTQLKNRYQFKFLMDFKIDSRIIEPVDGDFVNFALISELQAYLNSITNVDGLIISISGSDYLPICISNSNPPYDVILPSTPELPIIDNATVIPVSEIRSRLTKDIRHILLGIQEIKRLTNLPLYYLQSPPPIGSNSHIESHSAWAKNIIEKNGISPASLRYKIWQIHSDLIEEKCNELKIPYFYNPSELFEDGCYLHRNAYADDLMHANTWYGKIFLTHIDGRI